MANFTIEQLERMKVTRGTYGKLLTYLQDLKLNEAKIFVTTGTIVGTSDYDKFLELVCGMVNMNKNTPKSIRRTMKDIIESCKDIAAMKGINI